MHLSWAPSCDVISWRKVSQVRGLTFYYMYVLVFNVVLCCRCCCCVWDKGWSRICDIVKASLEFGAVLLQPPRCWGYRCASPAYLKGDCGACLKERQITLFWRKKLQVAFRSLPYLLKGRNTLLLDLDLLLVFTPRVCRQKPCGRLPVCEIDACALPHHYCTGISLQVPDPVLCWYCSLQETPPFFPAVQSSI